MDVLLIGNDQVIEVTGVQDGVTGDYIDDATVSVRLKFNGSDVSGQTWPLTLDYVTDSNGDYRGVLQSSIDLRTDRRYTIELSINGGGGLVGYWEFKRSAIFRTP